MFCDPLAEAARGALEILKSLASKPSIVGVGTGRTVSAFLKLLSESDLARDIAIVPSSLETAMLASSLGLRVVDSRVVDRVDVYIDGADEVAPDGSMLKGGGGALLGEKIIAYNSKLNIFIVSEDKLVERIGSTRPIPVEIEPNYISMIKRSIESIGYRVEVRESQGKRGPVVSDWGGVILDVATGPVSNPLQLDEALKSIPGVIETGVFVGFIDYLVVGLKQCGFKIVSFERRRRRGD